MKVFKKLILAFLLITAAMAQEQGLNARAQKIACTKNSDYFALTIPSFDIRPSQTKDSQIVNIHLRLHNTTATIFYDRPVRKINVIKIQDLMEYLACDNKKDLTLTLMVADFQHHKALPLVFRILKHTYSPEKHEIKIVAKLVPSPAFEHLKESQFFLKGTSSSLLIDG